MKDKVVDIVHIGLHNTGTTWLQKCFFPLIKDITIMSNEDYSGLPWQGHQVSYRYMLAYGLKQVYPDAKIIIGFREEDDWVLALYRHYVKRGGYRGYEDWYENVFDNRHCDFFKYLYLLSKLFDDIFIYHFENFKSDKKHVLSDMCDFMGCELPKYDDVVVNRGWKDGLLSVGLFFNRCVCKCRGVLNLLNNKKS